MKPYIAQIRCSLRLMGRDRAVLFFSYLFPLGFYFVLAQAFHGRENPGAMAQVISMVLIIGVLNNGFFGAGMRAVQDRETNVLRRFKVAPISGAPIIVSSLVSGLVTFLPSAFLMFFFSAALYRTPWPRNLLSIIVFVCIGVIAFRSIGMIIAAVVNSAQEAAIIVQLFYLPMLFLSGATFPTSLMPVWIQAIAQFLPATYLFMGVQSLIAGGAGLIENWVPVLALAVTTTVAVLVGTKLFRWEKEEKIRNSAKLWVLAVLVPFLLMGIYQARTKGNIREATILAHKTDRNRAVLFQNARIFVGDGTVIANGAVLVRNGKIAEVFATSPAETKEFSAEVIEASGKTLIPGLIDALVHLDAPGGVYQKPSKYADPHALEKRLAAYLYSGITAVRSSDDGRGNLRALHEEIESGEYLGAELFLCGPAPQPPDSSCESSESLSAAEAAADVARGSTELLSRSLVQQVGPTDLLSSTRAMLEKQRLTGKANQLRAAREGAKQNLLNAYQAGAMLVIGSDAGKLLIVHGPTVQHEMLLWAKAGIPPAVALEAATYNAARMLGAADRIGSIRKGRDATMVLLDGDPLEDISNTERISMVLFRGERVARAELFDQHAE